MILTTLLAVQLAAASPMIAPRHDGGFATEDSSAMTLVLVQNNRHVPVTVWAEDAWGDFKLGVVAADGSGSFFLKPRLLMNGQVRLFVISPGRANEDTGLLQMSPGDAIGVTVPQ